MKNKFAIIGLGQFGMTIAIVSRHGYITVIETSFYLVIPDQIKVLCHFQIYTISSFPWRN